MSSVETVSKDFNSTPSEESQGGISRWIGLADCRDAISAFQKKEYRSALKCAAIGLLKFATFGAAAFGIYKWVAGETVYLNDFMKQSTEDFSKNSHQSFVPSSVSKMTNLFYNEHKTFSKWPKSGQELFTKHLTEDAPMSSSIVTHLMAEAAKRNDRSFEKLATKTCKTPTVSSQSCLTVLDNLTDSTNPQSLSNAVSISKGCKKHNLFCSKALEKAQDLTLNTKSLSDLNSLIEILSRKGVNLEKSRPFIEAATDLIKQNFKELKKKILDCTNMKPESEADCYSHFSVFERIDYLDRPYRKERLFEAKRIQAEKDLKNAISNYGLKLANICLKLQNSESCKQFISYIIPQLLDVNLVDDALRLITQLGSLENEVPKMITALSKQGKWEQGVHLILTVLKKFPNLDIKKVASDFIQQISVTDQANLAVDLMTWSEMDAESFAKIFSSLLSDQNEVRLFKLYLVAKSWIQPQKVNHPQKLMQVIQRFFDLYGERGSYFGPVDTMAKVLTSNWLKTANYTSRYRYPSMAWQLSHEPGCSHDEYYPDVERYNWKVMLNESGLT